MFAVCVPSRTNDDSPIFGHRLFTRFSHCTLLYLLAPRGFPWFPFFIRFGHRTVGWRMSSVWSIFVCNGCPREWCKRWTEDNIFSKTKGNMDKALRKFCRIIASDTTTMERKFGQSGPGRKWSPYDPFLTLKWWEVKCIYAPSVRLLSQPDHGVKQFLFPGVSRTFTRNHLTYYLRPGLFSRGPNPVDSGGSSYLCISPSHLLLFRLKIPWVQSATRLHVRTQDALPSRGDTLLSSPEEKGEAGIPPTSLQ